MDTKEEIRDADETEDIGAAWAAEIDKRIAEVEAGVEAVRWEEARARVRSKLSKTSQ